MIFGGLILFYGELTKERRISKNKMKKLLKTLKNMPKGTLIKVVNAIIGLVISGAIFVVSSVVLAWFSTNEYVTASGMQLIVTTDNFEVWVRNDDEYGQDKYEEISDMITDLKSYLNDQGYEGLAFELENEVEDSNGFRYLRPGAYGSLSFYIKPKVDSVNPVFNVSLETVGLVYEEGEIKPYEPSAEEQEGDEGEGEEEEAVDVVKDLLKGHILFFAQRGSGTHSQYVYHELIEGTFVYDTAGEEKVNINDDYYYEVVFYWVWPLTYEEITDTERYNYGSTQSSLYDNYISPHPEYFFKADDPEEYFEDNENNLYGLSDGYNDGDQMIGDRLKVLAVYMSVTAG